MILDVVPVIPPELRPMVQLDGGRFATSDLNDLYRRVINRNNRLKRLLDLGAPEIIVNNEKRMLQEAVDALFDNGRRGRPGHGPGQPPAEVAVRHAQGQAGPVPPEPARQARRLLRPFGHRGRPDAQAAPVRPAQADGARAVQALRHEAAGRPELAQNIKSAKRMVERRRPQVWDVLEEVIKEHPVLLNRAPTLHRLGIQAFEPVLVEGKAIQIHPLVCTAFNADFDGDQMAVHLPLSAEAQAEARVLMLSPTTSCRRRHGRPLVTPTQDMIIGAYYLTELVDGRQGRGPRLPAPSREVERAYESGRHLAARQDQPAATTSALDGDDGRRRPARRTARPVPLRRVPARRLRLHHRDGRSKKRDGRDRRPAGQRATPRPTVADQPRRASRTCASASPPSRASPSRSTTSRRPPEKRGILDDHEKEADKVEQQFRRGIITDGERRQKEVEIWTNATDEVREAMEQDLGPSSSTPST